MPKPVRESRRRAVSTIVWGLNSARFLIPRTVSPFSNIKAIYAGRHRVATVTFLQNTLADLFFKPIYRRFQFLHSQVWTKTQCDCEQNLIWPELHGEQVTHFLDSRL
jgi:hypothetical protein